MANPPAPKQEDHPGNSPQQAAEECNDVRARGRATQEKVGEPEGARTVDCLILITSQFIIIYDS
jgi:hypothetical protein